MLGYGPHLFQDEKWVQHCLDEPSSGILKDIVLYSLKFRREALEKLMANPPESNFELDGLLTIPEISEEAWGLIKSCKRHTLPTLRGAFNRLDSEKRKEAWQLLVAEYSNLNQQDTAIADDWFLMEVAERGDLEYREEAKAVIARLQSLPKPYWKTFLEFKVSDAENA
jgi:hypothetical protein